jgi:hypothetical protein
MLKMLHVASHDWTTGLHQKQNTSDAADDDSEDPCDPWAMSLPPAALWK